MHLIAFVNKESKGLLLDCRVLRPQNDWYAVTSGKSTRVHSEQTFFSSASVYHSLTRMSLSPIFNVSGRDLPLLSVADPVANIKLRHVN